MSLLFIHNTMAEYRIPLFIGLSKEITVDYLFTKIELSKEIYGVDAKTYINDELNFECLDKGLKRYFKLSKYVSREKYKYILLPPLDSFGDLLDAIIILFQSKLKKKKLLYFGEKWEAPKCSQTKIKRVKNFIQKCAFKFILNKIDMCIVSGSKAHQYFEGLGIKNEKISVAIDASGVKEKLIAYKIKEKYKLSDDTKIILYYGRIVERKGLDLLIRAYSELKYKGINSCLLICGDGPFKRDCERLVKELQLDKVIFEGFVDPSYKYTFFSQCDIFVLPSYFYNGIPEAWGLTVNEAMQCGKPVIATTAVGAAYDLINGKNGKMIQENNINELVNSLNELLTSENKEKIKEECKNVYEKFNYDNMINSFIKAINKIS